MQIGRYRILDELGRGATGVVYRAQDPAIGRTIAIKTIRLSDITDQAERDRLRERLFREAKAAGILSHPNIVTIYDIAEENGLAYIFMECVDGPSLEKVLNNQQALEKQSIFSILRQTATALDYAHKKGIVHRDIKPANILIHEGATAKIADFGVAKIISQQMTHAGVMMGTPNYMSPEQVQGHAIDGRADQFSLAVVAYEVLTGEKPFVADQLPSLLFRIVREDPVPPQRLNPTLAPQVEVVLRKALSKTASDRYLSCTEFVDALATACDFNPHWQALPRTVAQNLPTVGGGLTGAASAAPRVPEPRRVPEPEPASQVIPPDFLDTTSRERSSGNPILKSLAWMLVGIGLVGLVLFGAQKYLFNRYSEPAPQEASNQQDQSGVKPSPMGDAAAAATPPPAAQPPATPPPATKPESTAAGTPDAPETKPAQPPPQSSATSPAPSAPTPPEQPAQPPPQTHVRSTPPPVIVPKSDAQQQVQFVTEPPNAQLTVDRNSAQSCKTPCLIALSPGRHSLEVHLDGYRAYPRIFTVPDEKELFLQLTKTGGTLSITSSPPGATVEINGEMQGKRTPALFNYPPGNYRVKVTRNGAFLEFDVQLRDGEFINKKIDF